MDKKIQKKSYPIVDQSNWSEKQKLMFYNAKNEFEKEFILNEIAEA